MVNNAAEARGKAAYICPTHIVQRAMQRKSENHLLLMKNTGFDIREVRDFSAAPAADSLQILYRPFYRPEKFREPCLGRRAPKVIMMQCGAGWPLHRRGREALVVLPIPAQFRCIITMRQCSKRRKGGLTMGLSMYLKQVS